MPIYPYRGVWPTVAEDAFIAPTAVLIGDVTVEAGASVWFGAVIRGDVAPIQHRRALECPGQLRAARRRGYSLRDRR